MFESVEMKGGNILQHF